MPAGMLVCVAWLLTMLPLVAGAEIGLRFGRRRRTESDAEGRNQIMMVEGALLGLLALLLGFTFNMAVDRFDIRADLVVKEANALVTVSMRADFLSDGAQPGFRAKLKEYAQNRLAFVAAGNDHDRLREVEKTACRIESDLWTFVRDDSRMHPTPPVALLAEGLGNLLDFRELRFAALDNQVPQSVWIVLYAVAIITSTSLGLGSGLTGKRLLFSVFLVPLLLASILTLLIDLDRPHKGLIQVPQDSMHRAVQSLK